MAYVRKQSSVESTDFLDFLDRMLGWRSNLWLYTGLFIWESVCTLADGLWWIPRPVVLSMFPSWMIASSDFVAAPWSGPKPFDFPSSSRCSSSGPVDGKESTSCSIGDDTFDHDACAALAFSSLWVVERLDWVYGVDGVLAFPSLWAEQPDWARDVGAVLSLGQVEYLDWLPRPVEELLPPDTFMELARLVSRDDFSAGVSPLS